MEYKNLKPNTCNTCLFFLYLHPPKNCTPSSISIQQQMLHPLQIEIYLSGATKTSMITVLSDLKRNPRLDGLQLHPHALWREQFWGDAGWAQRASWTGARLAWPVQPITHEEVLHRYQHCMGLLFCHHGPACLYLQGFVPISHDARNIDLSDERCRNLMIDFLNQVTRGKKKSHA